MEEGRLGARYDDGRFVTVLVKLLTNILTCRGFRSDPSYASALSVNPSRFVLVLQTDS